jgi:hypothetical protein
MSTRICAGYRCTRRWNGSRDCLRAGLAVVACLAACFGARGWAGLGPGIAVAGLVQSATIVSMWARVHKIDRIRPQPGGGAIVLVEDERSAAAMGRLPCMSIIVAIARVLNARRVIATRYGGKGEVRYAANATLPGYLYDAVVRAGAGTSDRTGDKLMYPAQPASVAAILDVAFSDLAHYTRGNVGVPDMSTALRTVEGNRRKSPLDREQHPALYWPAVFELAALAGELSRPQGGRWIETTDMPVPFAIKLASGSLVIPTKLAQRIVEGESVEESMTQTAGDDVTV